jgi:trk system potassium uptake protein TrkA
MARRVLVIGLGRFGSSLAESLAQSGCEVIAVDNDMSHIDAIKQKVAYALELDATDPNALRSVDAHTCHAAVVAVTTRHGRILLAAGASRVVEIESEMGRALGRELAGGADLAAQAAAAVMGPPPAAAGGPGPAGPPPGYPR